MAAESETEAECLLRSGAAFGERILIRSPGSDPTFVGVRPSSASIYSGDAPIYHLDLDGRWQRAFIDGVHYLRGLDGVVQSIDRIREGGDLVLRRRTLPLAESMDVDESARRLSIDLLSRLGSSATLDAPPPPARPLDRSTLAALLDRIASIDAARWFSLREAHSTLYPDRPIVPPDAVGSVRLGGLPPGESESDDRGRFAAHARAVADLWGRRLSQTNSVYLSDDGIWDAPADVLHARFAVVRDVFGGRSIQGRIGSAVDVAVGVDWPALRALGLSSMTIEAAMPAGDRSPGRALALATALALSGIRVRITLAVGAGVPTDHPDFGSLATGLPTGTVVYLTGGPEIAGVEADPDGENRRRLIAIREAWTPIATTRGVHFTPYSASKQGF